MATTFDDLVREAQPALRVVDAEVTEGRSWEFTIEILGADDTAPDLSSVTIDAKVLDEIDGSTLVTFSTSVSASAAGNNVITLTAAPGVTAGSASAQKLKRSCPWHLTLTNASSRKLDVWGVQESRIVICQGA